MKFNFDEAKKYLGMGYCVIVQCHNGEETNFLLEGIGIGVRPYDTMRGKNGVYVYLRKHNGGYNRTYDDVDVYEGENIDTNNAPIKRMHFIDENETVKPKEILLNTINECKSKDGYTVCVITDDEEIYFAIDDDTLVGDYGYISIKHDLDDDLHCGDGRVIEIFTAKINSLDDYSDRNTVWEYNEQEEFIDYCNKHNITPEDLVKYFGIKLNK